MQCSSTYCQPGSDDLTQRVSRDVTPAAVVCVVLQCSGAFCQPGSDELTQRIELVSSVHFVDASKRAVGEDAEDPVLSDVSVADDFFYPFS